MKLFVWDFHGTLEKGTEKAATEITNRVLEEAGYSERLTEIQTLQLFGRKWYEYFAFLLPALPREIHLNLERKCYEVGQKYPHTTYGYTQANDNALQVLSSIKQAEHCQILISNTRLESLHLFLRKTNLHAFFPLENVFASDSKSKEEVFLRFLEGKTFSQIIIIGDSPQDIHLGKLVRSTTYLYSHPQILFRECNADYKIKDLREILKEL